MVEGGSHWSLLCYVRCQTTFYHCDPSKSVLNLTSATNLAARLSDYLQLQNSPRLEKICGPTQDNGHDCGLYIVLDTEYIIKNSANLDKFKWTIPFFNAQDCMMKRALLTYILHNR